jgi:hypothetical protein
MQQQRQQQRQRQQQWQKQVKCALTREHLLPLLCCSATTALYCDVYSLNRPVSPHVPYDSSTVQLFSRVPLPARRVLSSPPPPRVRAHTPVPSSCDATSALICQSVLLPSQHYLSGHMCHIFAPTQVSPHDRNPWGVCQGGRPRRPHRTRGQWGLILWR